MKNNTKITYIILLILGTIGCHADGWLEPSILNPRYVRASTNTTLARLHITADSDGFSMTQIAFGVSVSGTWIHEQVRNVRLVDENGNVIAGPEEIWSQMILCDCDSGRVIFDTVNNFVVSPSSSREFTVVADIYGIDGKDGAVTISYQRGDSRTVDTKSMVNSTLSAVRNVDSEKFFGTFIEIPLVPGDYAVIKSYSLSNVPGTDKRVLNLFGIIEPNTEYKVEATSDLIHWEEIGQVNKSISSEVLKEPAVGIIDSKYGDTVFFRLKKIQN